MKRRAEKRRWSVRARFETTLVKIGRGWGVILPERAIELAKLGDEIAIKLVGKEIHLQRVGS